jgi:hypothetical protein
MTDAPASDQTDCSERRWKRNDAAAMATRERRRNLVHVPDNRKEGQKAKTKFFILSSKF